MPLRVIENAIGSSHAGRGRRIHVQHNLQQRRCRRARSLLKAGDRLREKRLGVPLGATARRSRSFPNAITLSIYSHALPADTNAAAKIWNNAMADVVAAARKPAEGLC
jgi:hypothetical protein